MFLLQEWAVQISVIFNSKIYSSQLGSSAGTFVPMISGSVLASSHVEDAVSLSFPSFLGAACGSPYIVFISTSGM